MSFRLFPYVVIIIGYHVLTMKCQKSDDNEMGKLGEQNSRSFGAAYIYNTWITWLFAMYVKKVDLLSKCPRLF